MPSAKYTVVYEAAGVRHKLLKLILADDGSYFATCPYHVSDRVSLSRLVINYADVKRRAGEPPLELAVLDDDQRRLKLSHHPDGFVQFSGYGIRSGKKADGSPKGLGIYSFPLTRPTAGPTFGLSVLNPAAFKQAGPPRRNDVVFREQDMFMSVDDTGLIVEAYYFSPEWRRFVYNRDGGMKLLLRHPSGALLDLRVCRSARDDWGTGFMGLDLFPAPIKFGSAASGFVLSSPTQLREYENGELEGEALYASYPPWTDDIRGTPMSLAFRPREDPPYRKGELGPTEDEITMAVREAMARRAQARLGGTSDGEDGTAS